MYGNHSEIENNIFWFGIENYAETESLKLWCKLAKNSGTIIDAGAFTGLYALSAKTVNKSAIVVAFEPTQYWYKKLTENAHINNFDILAVNKAVSDVTGLTHIQEVYQDEKQVEAIRLDDFVAEKKFTSVDLVKLDVEKHEPEALTGFLSTLGSNKPAMIVECVYKEVGERIQKILEPFDYLFFEVDEEKGAFQVKNITGSRHYNYLICQPHHAEFLQLKQEILN
jgi:FkbM family methyltransferase